MSVCSTVNAVEGHRTGKQHHIETKMSTHQRLCLSIGHNSTNYLEREAHLNET